MKLVRYEHHGFPLLGIVRHGLVQGLPQGLSVLDVLNMPLSERNLLEAQAGRRHRTPIESVRLLPPIEPRAMRDFVAFEKHIAGMKKSEPGDGSVPAAWYAAPVHLYMNPWSVVGANDDVAAPPETEALDFELEVAAIIGRTARNVSVDEAESFIAGYCVMNDWSARDIQGREMSVGLGPSKGKDFATTLGPWITTADELDEYREGDRLALDMSVSVNEVEVGRDNSREMSWSWAEIVSHTARGATVGAGDVLASGTCSGGSLAEIWARAGQRTPPPLTPGDVVEMTIEGLGTIRNRVVASEPLPEPVRPRERSAV